MRLGVGLPATVPGAPGALVLEWARRADAGPFSSIAVFDRLLYDNYEPFCALAAAAACTRRVKLATTVLIAPLRSPILLAKQAATVDALSGGRLVLGVGLGARRDDYDASQVTYRSRGRILTETLATMRDVWEDGHHGPATRRSTGPPLLVGGAGGLAMARMVRYADGFIHNGGPPRAFARSANEARAAWEAAERPGRPELWGMGYFAFGAATSGRAYLHDYYAFTGPFAERIAAGLLTTPQELLEFIRGYEEVGCDELLLFPTVPHMDQLDRLIEVIAT